VCTPCTSSTVIARWVRATPASTTSRSAASRRPRRSAARNWLTVPPARQMKDAQRRSSAASWTAVRPESSPRWKKCVRTACRSPPVLANHGRWPDRTHRCPPGELHTRPPVPLYPALVARHRLITCLHHPRCVIGGAEVQPQEVRHRHHHRGLAAEVDHLVRPGVRVDRRDPVGGWEPYGAGGCGRRRPHTPRRISRRSLATRLVTPR
jgi:hypothetical protein